MAKRKAIELYRTSDATKTPDASNLHDGELAVCTNDFSPKIFLKVSGETGTSVATFVDTMGTNKLIGEQVGPVASDVSILQTDVLELQKSATTAASQISKIETDLLDVEDNYSELSDSISQLSAGTVDEISAARNDYDTKIGDVDSNVSVLQGDITTINQKLDNFKNPVFVFNKDTQLTQDDYVNRISNPECMLFFEEIDEQDNSYRTTLPCTDRTFEDGWVNLIFAGVSDDVTTCSDAEFCSITVMVDSAGAISYDLNPGIIRRQKLSDISNTYVFSSDSDWITYKSGQQIFGNRKFIVYRYYAEGGGATPTKYTPFICNNSKYNYDTNVGTLYFTATIPPENDQTTTLSFATLSLTLTPNEDKTQYSIKATQPVYRSFDLNTDKKIEDAISKLDVDGKIDSAITAMDASNVVILTSGMTVTQELYDKILDEKTLIYYKAAYPGSTVSTRTLYCTDRRYWGNGDTSIYLYFDSSSPSVDGVTNGDAFSIAAQRVTISKKSGTSDYVVRPSAFFENWFPNITMSGFTTNAKTITGAVNEIRDGMTTINSSLNEVHDNLAEMDKVTATALVDLDRRMKLEMVNGGGAITNIWVGTVADYDSMSAHSQTTLYICK